MTHEMTIKTVFHLAFLPYFGVGVDLDLHHAMGVHLRVSEICANLQEPVQLRVS